MHLKLTHIVNQLYFNKNYKINKYIVIFESPTPWYALDSQTMFFKQRHTQETWLCMVWQNKTTFNCLKKNQSQINWAPALQGTR